MKLALCFALLALGCGGPSGPALVGDFGYESPPPTFQAATVHAEASAATYSFQCMHGDSGPIRPDATGAFTASGSLSTTGGALRTFSDVTFSGTVQGEILTLNATWQTTTTTSAGTEPYTETFGPVTMTKGTAPTRFPGCV
jgi:hypothetical protein